MMNNKLDKEKKATDLENDFIINEDNFSKTQELKAQQLDEQQKLELDRAIETGADVNKINQKI